MILMYLSKYNLLLPLPTEISISSEWKSILLNTLTGNVAFLNQEYLEFLNDSKKAFETPTDHGTKISALRERGFIYNEKTEEMKTEADLIVNSLKYYHSKIPTQFVLSLTEECNLECRGCHYNQSFEYMNKAKIAKSLEFVEKILKESDPHLGPEIFIGGGEPLLDDRKTEISIHYLLSELTNKKWLPTIVTNGLNLPRYRTMLQQFPNLGIRIQLSTSTDSLTYDSPSIRGIDAIRNLHHNIFIDVYIADDEGLYKLPQFIDAVYSWGWGYSTNIFFTLQAASNQSCPMLTPCRHDNTLSFFAKFLEIFEKVPLSSRFTLSGISPLLQFSWLLYRREYIPPSLHFCRASLGLFVLTSEGDVYPCLEAQNEPSLKIGSFFPRLSLDNNVLQQWRKRHVTNIPECTDCKFRYACCGGCAMKSYRARKDIFTPACEPVGELYQICFSRFYKDLLRWAPQVS